MKDTYNIKVHCDNCNAEQRVDIPKGITVPETKCPTCGCHTLRRSSW